MSATNNPVAKMRGYISGWLEECRTGKMWGEMLGVEVAQDIAADVVAHERAAAAEAHKIETGLDEVLVAIAKAQAPDSEGGANITLNEAKSFAPILAARRDRAHDMGEMLAI